MTPQPRPGIRSHRRTVFRRSSVSAIGVTTDENPCRLRPYDRHSCTVCRLRARGNRIHAFGRRARPTRFRICNRKFSCVGRLLVLQGDVLTAFTLDRNHNVYIAGGPGKPQTCPFTGAVTVNEYAAGVYGQPPPTRHIDLGRPCSIPSIAVTGSGNVAVAAVYMKRKRTRFVIREFPFRGSGELKPIRAIELGPAPVSNLVGDARGDIYALIGSPSSSNGGTIVEYGPTGAGSRRLKISGDVLGFALDARARIFAALAGIGGTTIAEVDGFRSGSRVPFARLKGKKTRFDGALLIGIAARQ
jgi:hypothetical protein